MLILLFVSSGTFAQAIYDANGQYKGYQQTSPSGVTNAYNVQGQNVGSSQVDNSQTNYDAALVQGGLCQTNAS